ncbi:MAG: 4Fe-4S binding protein [Planctomycetes bacterium]|nr:4Fe-4S binding protein [Planctomycetota bacterium]
MNQRNIAPGSAGGLRTMNVFLPYRSPSGGRPGLLRRVLRALGPSWEAAPVRRLVQAAAFVLFLALFFHVAWPYGGKDYDAFRRSKEFFLEAEAFLALDPLVSVSAAVAARTWVWSLAWAGVLLAACLVFPRGFCGYICPLGTLIDLCDWAFNRRIRRARGGLGGGARHARYYVLAAVMASAALGVLISGYVAAIPVLLRGMAFIASPVQLGLAKGWYLVPPVGAGQIVSAALFLGVLALGLAAPRFWCRYVCPSGAVFSAANLLRVCERRVDASCIGCGKCVKACPFQAIRPDFSTRAAECTFCQTCGGSCPVGAISFTSRWAPAASARESPAAPPDARLSRRGLLGGAAFGAAAAVGLKHGRLVGGAAAAGGQPPVRPPGSVPEPEFLRLCIRCGECFQACPNNVLQPMGAGGGLDALWTPYVAADWSGCEPSCNNCGQVCPTGAIRALVIEEKRAVRMGLAVIDATSCLPHIGFEGNCRLCVDECIAAGYNAIDLVRINVALDTDGTPIEGSGNLVPVVDAAKCVGCGMCQMRCHKINVAAEKMLDEAAIRVVAGPGREDRLMSGSYRALREAESRERDALRRGREGGGVMPGDTYLPDFLR